MKFNSEKFTAYWLSKKNNAKASKYQMILNRFYLHFTVTFSFILKPINNSLSITRLSFFYTWADTANYRDLRVAKLDWHYWTFVNWVTQHTSLRQSSQFSLASSFDAKLFSRCNEACISHRFESGNHKSEGEKKQRWTHVLVASRSTTTMMSDLFVRFGFICIQLTQSSYVRLFKLLFHAFSIK